MISDRDKGFKKAMHTSAPDAPHFLFPPFDGKFQNEIQAKVVEEFGWILARSRTTEDYEKAKANITSSNSSVLL